MFDRIIDQFWSGSALRVNWIGAFVIMIQSILWVVVELMDCRIRYRSELISELKRVRRTDFGKIKNSLVKNKFISRLEMSQIQFGLSLTQIFLKVLP